MSFWTIGFLLLAGFFLVLRNQKKVMSLLNKWQATRIAEEANEPDWPDLILSDSEDFLVTLKTDPSSKTYQIKTRTDSPTLLYETCEYKIENEALFSRTLDLEDAIDNIFDIQDGVVLESEVSQRLKQAASRSEIVARLDEGRLEKLIKKTEWHEIRLHKIKLYVMHYDPMSISVRDFRRYLRKEKERILKGNEAVKTLIENNGGKIIVHEDKKRFDLSNPSDTVTKEKLVSIIEDESTFTSRGISSSEFTDDKEILALIEEHLSQTSPT